jgi:hypothetical protein
MHWLLDVGFKDDRSRYQTSHGAKNVAIVRHFAFSLVRADKREGSVKTKKKIRRLEPRLSLELLQLK